MHNPWNCRLDIIIPWYGICMSLFIAYQSMYISLKVREVRCKDSGFTENPAFRLTSAPPPPPQWRWKLLPAAGRVWAMPLLGVRTPDTSTVQYSTVQYQCTVLSVVRHVSQSSNIWSGSCLSKAESEYTLSALELLLQHRTMINDCAALRGGHVTSSNICIYTQDRARAHSATALQSTWWGWAAASQPQQSRHSVTVPAAITTHHLGTNFHVGIWTPCFCPSI